MDQWDHQVHKADLVHEVCEERTVALVCQDVMVNQEIQARWAHQARRDAMVHRAMLEAQE